MNSTSNLADSKSQIIIGWLKNGVIALGIAGIYSIILVILRTPSLNKLIANTQIFKSALIIHVNLSVLVWLLSITASIWSFNLKYLEIGKVCLKLALCSTIIMGISPFFGDVAVMNNYIPMLENIIFIIGLSLFGVVMLIFCISIIINIEPIKKLLNGEKDIIIEISAYTSALMFVIVWACFSLSYNSLAKIMKLVPIDIDFYYELLYWSGGHTLQFIYTQILMVTWIILFQNWLNKELKHKKLYVCLILINFLISLGVFFGHIYFDIITPEFKEYYTNQMKYGGGISPVLCLIILCLESRPNWRINNTYIKTSIICSSLLFLSGGFIGLLISGVNVTIPAHYHGSIVGISIAFMGLAYSYVFTEKCAWGIKYAQLQLYIITLGQILHISGLAYAGGYGVLRKSTETSLVLKAKIALGLMGGGGLLAIIGGLMFVIICGRNLTFNKIKQIAKTNR